MNKIRKGDQVEVISGRADDKGKRGEVIKVVPEDNVLVVQGVNLQTKHQKQVQAQGRTVKPGLVRFEGPISIANVMLVCPKCGKVARVHFSRQGDSVSRVCNECDAVIDA